MFSSKDLFFTPAAGGFTVSKSLRFRSSATAYLNRTPGSAGNRKTWTWSGWVKRGKLSSGQMFFEAGNTSGTTNSDLLIFQFNSADNIRIDTGASVLRVTNAVFRDPSAWYHIVILMDTTQASNNSTRIFVNSVEQTYSTTNNIPQNTDTAVNNTVAHYLGRYDGSVNFFDGYMAEVNFVDGSALTPSSFGAYDTNGIWQPAAYTGSYGTNGFYLKFTDVGTTTAGGANTGYGKDFAGTNNWTTNNFGTTSTGTSAPLYDSMLDSPTNATGDIGNYAVMNPLDRLDGSLSGGNLDITTGTVSATNCRSTFAMQSGKWYWEMTPTTNGGIADIGISIYPGSDVKTGTNYTYQADTGNKYSTAGGAVSYGSTYTTNDVISVAYDATNGKIWWAKNGTWQASGDPANGTNAAFSSITGDVYAWVTDRNVGSTCVVAANFGQRPFIYTPPSGFSALNTQNLSTPTITNGAQYMAAVTYQGATAPNTVTTTSSNSGNNPNGTTFQPDLVWIKSRSAATDHKLTDAVRGTTKALISNSTGVETTDTNGLTAFTASGFTVGSDTTYNNTTGPATYVAWEWNAGGSNATNTSGSITSTVRANTSAGFSIVTWTGSTSSSNQTVGHGLGVTPSLVILKNRNFVDGWYVWSSTFANTTTDYLVLNTTAAKATAAGTIWGAGMTSSLCGVRPATFCSASTDSVVMYCFAPVAGYSAFGSYTGNGSTDGPFVYTGFRPRWIMFKRTDSTSDWHMYDSSRDTYNQVTNYLAADLSNAESTVAFGDFCSNGFKLRASGAGFNASGGTFIYAAFAENPFKISRAR